MGILRDFFDNLSLDGADEGSAFEDYMAHSYPKDLVVKGNDDGQECWRCLMCLTGGIASADTIDLAVAVHAETCNQNEELAKMRFELLDMISGVSESWFAAGWLSGIEKILLKRGGLWLLLAEQVGFPQDWQGLKGWSLNAQDALAHHGISPAEVSIWPPMLGPRP